VTTGYKSDLQGGLHLINNTNNNTITGADFSGNGQTGLASGGNGFYADPCADKANEPFSPEGMMGSNNSFSPPICYQKSIDIATLPPSTCKG
jgi:hypothetical protein